MSISPAPLPNGKAPGVNRMIRLWQQLTEPSPLLTSVNDRRRAQLLSIFTLILSLLFIVALIYGPASYGTFLTLSGITLASYALSRTRYYRAGNYLFTYAFTALAYMRIFTGSAESIEAAVASTVHITLAFSSVLLSRRGFAGLVALAALAAFAAPLYSNIPGEPENTGRIGGVVLVIGAILYAINVFRENLEKEQRRELNDANRQLEDIKADLEKRIEERTLELQTASLQAQDRANRLQNITDISQEIASNITLKTEDLLARAAQIISEKLGYYHVGVFLLDEKREYAVLRAANSDGGKRMLERRHQLKAGGAGIVGYVAQSGRPRIALDTGADAVFFDNPDLPETRSEISVPLKFENTVLGVLDVQSTQPAAFKEEDINLLGALANLLALVVRNRQLAEGSGSDAAARRPIHLRRKRRQSGYAFRPDGIVAADAPPDKDPLMQKAIVSGEVVVQNQTDTGALPALAVPVKLRERVIGILHIKAADVNRRWTEDEINVAQAISERAAFALENALLLEDATRRAEQEQTLAQITTRIGASTDFERIMKTAVQELGQALGASRSFIQIGSPTSEKDKD